MKTICIGLAAVIFGFNSFAEAGVESSSQRASATPSTGVPSKKRAPADWMAWAKWAEKLHPVTDAQGHGPDIGGDEWANALSKKLGLGDPTGKGLKVGSAEWRKAVESILVPTEVEDQKADRKLLSSHDTEAVFVGLSDHRCMGRTSLCPDQCGDSGKLATFKITKYLDFKKPGEYGDPKQESFAILVEDNMKQPKVPVPIRDAIFALKAGDSVHLQWNHDYVSRGGAQFPERPVVRLTPLMKEPGK